MTGIRPDSSDSPERAPGPRPWAIAAFAVALEVALVVCAYGFISLLGEIDPVPDPAIGRVPVPFAIGLSSLALLLYLGRALRHPRSALVTALVAALVAWAALVTGLVLALVFGTADAVLETVVWSIAYGLGWFGLVVPVAAAGAASAAVLVARGSHEGARRPRWPWEDEYDE